jgi:hypothetical protein
MKKFALILPILIALTFTTPAAAQDSEPPVDPQSAWGEVVDQNGAIMYESMTDLGIVTTEETWMPTIPGIGTIPAEYHEYQTASGNIVLMPTPTTLLFMSINQNESGIQNAQQLATGAAMLTEMTAGMDLPPMAQTNPDAFWGGVLSGQTNIFSLLGPQAIPFLSSLLNRSIKDQNAYLTLLLYAPSQCAQIPGGCPPGMNLINKPPLIPPQIITDCPASTFDVGDLSVSAAKIAPAYPVVVGQDEERRGADVTWMVRIEPTIQDIWIPVPIYGDECVPLDGGTVTDCKTSNGKPGKWTKVVVRYECQEDLRIYRESLNWITPYASLSQTSRDWILNELNILYPGAYLHHPDFSWVGNPGAGYYEGDTYVWNWPQASVQFADPGYYDLGVSGSTSGTPVSEPRGFRRGGSRMGVWLIEAVIIK